MLVPPHCGAHTPRAAIGWRRSTALPSCSASCATLPQLLAGGCSPAAGHSRQEGLENLEADTDDTPYQKNLLYLAVVQYRRALRALCQAAVKPSRRRRRYNLTCSHSHASSPCNPCASAVLLVTTSTLLLPSSPLKLRPGVRRAAARPQDSALEE